MEFLKLLVGLKEGEEGIFKVAEIFSAIILFFGIIKGFKIMYDFPIDGFIYIVAIVAIGSIFFFTFFYLLRAARNYYIAEDRTFMDDVMDILDSMHIDQERRLKIEKFFQKMKLKMLNFFRKNLRLSKMK